jgi:hypothetical protein
MAAPRLVGIVVAVLCSCCGCSDTTPAHTKLPELLREESFTCATLAEAANHYIALGEKAGTEELESHVVDWEVDHREGFSRNERIGWICRIVFQPRSAEPLRSPRYGALSLPWNTMSLANWPLYPLACSGSTYFVLSEGYMLGGVPEDPKSYLEYCRANGEFRTAGVPIPTRVEALKDSGSLRRSEAWQAIKWSDSGQGFSYGFSEAGAWRFIAAQAENVPRSEGEPGAVAGQPHE